MVQNILPNKPEKEDIEYIVPKTFIEKFKIFFYYKYTIPFMLLVLIPYYSLLLFYGHITNRAFFNAQITDPTMYGIVPIFLAFTSLNRYLIYKVGDLSKSKEIEKIFKNKTLFEDWRKNLYAFMTNNKILVPLAIVFSLGANYYWISGLLKNEMMINKVNYFSSPILVIAFYIGFFYWLIALLVISMFVLTLFKILYSIHAIGKRKEDLRINETIEKYYKIINGNVDNIEKTITYYQFQSSTRELGKFLFVLIFKAIIILLIGVLIAFLAVYLDVWGNYIFPISVATFATIILFLIPQFSIHKILKNTKSTLIETLDILSDELSEDIGDKMHSGKLSIDKLEFDMAKLKFIKRRKSEIQNIGTWTYDFPEILKLVGTAALTIIPLVAGVIFPGG